MWKIISLFTLVVLVQAADIHDIYGDWWEVAFYPATKYYFPVCLRFKFTESSDGVNCTYADGRNPTLVQATILNEMGEVRQHHSWWLMMVDTPAEVMPALNISVTCDGQDIRDRAVGRLVNEDYFIMYGNLPASMDHIRSEIEPNSVLLFSKKIVSSEQLGTIMSSIEDLKNRSGAPMCGTENYGGIKGAGN